MLCIFQGAIATVNKQRRLHERVEMYFLKRICYLHVRGCPESEPEIMEEITFVTAREAMEEFFSRPYCYVSPAKITIDWLSRNVNSELKQQRFTTIRSRARRYVCLLTADDDEHTVVLLLKAAEMLAKKRYGFKTSGHPPLTFTEKKYRCAGCRKIITVETEVKFSRFCKICADRHISG